MRREVAMPRSSTGNREWFTLIPMPAMIAEPSSWVRMPAHFPSDFFDGISTSLGQRRSHARSVAWRMASLTARPSASVTTGKLAGVNRFPKMTEKYRPEPGSECQLRPWRPWPAVCSSAPTTVPCAAPDAANRLATVMVEPITACHSMRRSRISARRRSQSIERVAVLLDLREVFGALGPQFLDDVRGRVRKEFFVGELAVNIDDKLFELVVFLEQAVANCLAIHFGKL